MDSNHRLPGYEPGALTSELSCVMTYSEFESEPRLSI